MTESQSMRPRFHLAPSAILRAAAAIVLPFGASVTIDQLRQRDWASLTLTGCLNEINARIEGIDAAAAMAVLANRLPNEDIAIPGQILAELVVQPGTANDGCVAFVLTALIIDE